MMCQRMQTFNSQMGKLEEELEEAAVLLQATCTAEDRLRAELLYANRRHCEAIEREAALQALPLHLRYRYYTYATATAITPC